MTLASPTTSAAALSVLSQFAANGVQTCFHGRHINPQILADAHEIAKKTGASIELMTDPHKAVRGVDAIYTDAWTSMGHERETEERTRIFPPYQVNDELMA
jgi:ornithine carbamoyltransferase